MSKEERYVIKVTDMERRIVLKALTLLKEQQIRENRNYDFIDELIVRTCDAEPIKRNKVYEER